MSSASIGPQNQKTLFDYFALTPNANKPKVEISLFQLPKEVLQIIFNSLDHSSLLHFEMCNQECQKYTWNAWQELKAKNHFNFKWKTTRKEDNPHKWDYCISCALHQYIFIDKYPSLIAPSVYTSNDFVLGQRIYAKFGGLIKRFPILSSYIGEDIKRLGCIDLPIKRKTIRKLNKTILEGQYAGELLLKGLILSRDKSNLEFTGSVFQQAVKKQATCASLFAIELLPLHLNYFSLKEFQWNLAIESAVQQDDQALIKLINRDGASFLLEKANEKFERKQFQAAEKLYEFVLTFDQFPKPTIFAMLATVKVKLKKWEDADKMFTLAFESYEDPSFNMLVNAALTKTYLEQWEEADRLINQALSCTSAPEIDSKIDVIILAANIKSELRKWKDADHLFQKALEAYGPHAPENVLAAAAFVKEKLNQMI